MATKPKQEKSATAGKGKAKEQARNDFREKEFWAAQRLPALILVVLAFALYGASIGYGYILDDKIVLQENKFVQKGFDGLGDIFGKESFTGFLGEQKDLVAGARYRPLSIASFAVEYSFFKESPKVSHFFNVLFYALTGLILFRVLSLFFRQAEGNAAWISIPFIAAALYVLHPLHTEVVANIKGRDEIFAVLFSLIAFWFSYRQFKTGSAAWAGLAGLAFLMGMLGKENAIMLLPILPLTFWMFLQAEKKDLLAMSVPYLIAAGIFLLMRTKAIGFFFSGGKEITELMNNPFYGVSFADKSATIFYTLGLYIKLLFFPHPLTHDYYPYHIPIIHWSDARAFLPLLFYIILAGLAFWGLRKKSVFSWSFLFFVLTISITSNFIFSVGTFMNERFLFMPSIAFCVLIAWLLFEKVPALAGASMKYLPIGLISVFALGFAWKTYSRVPDWKDQQTLDLSALKVSKNSARANSYVGYNLYRKALEEKDPVKQKALYDEALPHVNRALEIYPQYGDAITAKAGIIAGYFQQDGKLDVLLSGFRELLSRRHVEFIDQYMEYLNKRLGQAPQKIMLTEFYHQAGYEIFALKHKDMKLALKYLSWGRQLDANDLRIIQDLSRVYFEGKNYRNAQSLAEEGLKLNPSDSLCLEMLSKAKAALGS